MQTNSTNTCTAVTFLRVNLHALYADPENFVRGSNVEFVLFFVFLAGFFVDDGWVDTNSTISGPSAKRH